MWIIIQMNYTMFIMQVAFKFAKAYFGAAGLDNRSLARLKEKY
jgi:hypothetical protein